MFKILIVDDSNSLRLMVKKSLAKASGLFEITGEAENGKLAIEKYKELKPDLVTMDINMDVMNGLEALKEIMAFDPAAKVIMITSEGKAQALQAISFGAKNYLEKPATSAQILEAVKNTLGL